ncbi:chaplin [Streptomyces sp. NPDC023838]|uniref:chaplin n=1 Tax=Streptomyces sp. NPDC023838 TaxID=3154325 RepID=UPI0033D2BBB8
MRQVTRKGLITMAAATGVIAMGSGYAHADSHANGSATGSPGVASGNAVQAPVHVPVNACGNTVNIIGLLNPAMGNSCVNKGGSHHGGGGATAHGHASNSPGVASGNSVQAPVDVPVNACGNGVTVIGALNPVFGNDCANVSEGGHHAGTPHHPGKPGHPGHPGHPGKPGEPCEGEHPGTHRPGTPHHPGKPGNGVKPIHRTKPVQHPHTPGAPGTPAAPQGPGTQAVTAPQAAGALAHTGSDALGIALPAGAGLLLAGTTLYRRARSGA